MKQNDLKAHIIKILDDHSVGTLATIKEGKPFTRYMTFFHKGMTLYTATSEKTHKVNHIAENPSVHILIGYDGEGANDSFLEIEAQASLEDDMDLKRSLWNDKMSDYLSGPDDPEFIVIRCEPEKVTLMNDGEETPVTLERE
ncbi:pyridoxamine 5'-phosphate oxidase family protein [Bacillaceae bacterium SIJ1]|uniref:pyridoxamine 5'-phosphate oxidase family protein n=1 Tax=Litoribacterium kuwaitense TaxID=1398745 RepID=UPI0013EDE4E5|nr:pyridoxamine 5'-phosphate oxidase family protein [Litoribacterium kuwaitense]NGP46060.1 pyridoxamine 5'-phosphate oxidase family protein [Litoribacterium kuwaitense]